MGEPCAGAWRGSRFLTVVVGLAGAELVAGRVEGRDLSGAGVVLALGLGTAVTLAWAAGLLGMVPSCGRLVSREGATA